jgi:DNA-binding response OmpR family regulator
MDVASQPLVAVLNTSEDCIAILIELLEMEGFHAVADYIMDFRTGKKDIRGFFAEHQPDVVLYDIAIPYEKNWEFFQYIQAISGFKPCQFVLTTTNKTVLEGLVGETGSFEIVGKPTDLATLMTAVRASLEQCRD